MDNMPQPALPASAQLIAMIETVLATRGITRDRNRQLEAATGLEYQPVRRRMSGEIQWQAGELRALAAHFGEPLANLLFTLAGEPGIDANLAVGDDYLPCTAWISKDEADVGSPWRATYDSETGKWIVRAGSSNVKGASRAVVRLSWERKSRRGIVVVEDDIGIGEALVAYLEAQGQSSEAHYTASSAFQVVSESNQIDGFVVDWLLGAGQTAEPLLKAIRAKFPNTPLVLMTGKIAGGSVDAEAVARIGTSMNAVVMQKPIHPALILNGLRALSHP